MVAQDLEIFWEAPGALLIGKKFPRSSAHDGPEMNARTILRGRSDQLLASARALLGLPALPVPRGPRGEPIWPDRQRGSFSHWRERGVCLLRRGEDFDPGVDLEGFGDIEARAAIRQEALTATELEHVDGAGLGEGVAETLAFSAKECFFKAAYPRLRRELDFDAVEVIALDASRGVILRITQDLSSGLNEGARLSVACRLFDDHALTWLLLPVGMGPPPH